MFQLESPGIGDPLNHEMLLRRAWAAFKLGTFLEVENLMRGRDSRGVLIRLAVADWVAPAGLSYRH